MRFSPRMATRGVTLVAKSMSHPILDALPGFPMKISAALPALDKAWAEEGEDATRASQMNVILMFGEIGRAHV